MPIFNRLLIGWACLTDSMIRGNLFLSLIMVTLPVSLTHIPWPLSVHNQDLRDINKHSRPSTDIWSSLPLSTALA